MMDELRRHGVARLPITMVVIARNEATRVGRCLRSSHALVDESIVVVDLRTTDNTKDVAEAFGARVILQDWLGYAGQRNVGIDSARNDWILVLDADEVLSNELETSIRSLWLSGEPASIRSFGVDRPKDFMGSLMPSPARRKNVIGEVRLFNRRSARYDQMDEVHERVRVSAPPELLRGPLIHLQNLKFDEEITKMMGYSSLEAASLARVSSLKLQARLVVMPGLRFVWVFIGKGYWKFGLKGLVHARLRAFWECATYAKAVYERPPFNQSLELGE